MTQLSKNGIIEKSPARIDLISGGDHTHYINRMGWGACLNVTVNLYAFCKITPNNSLVYNKHDGMLELLLQHYKISNGKIETHQDYPRDSGIGGSASHATAIIKAFDRLQGIQRTLHESALLAYDIERNKMGEDGGYQDQFATSYRGFNYMVFRPEGTDVNRVQIQPDFLRRLQELSLLIHIPRKVTGDSIQKDMKIQSVSNLEIMKRKRDLAAQGRDALTNSDLDKIIELVGKDYDLRKQESSLIDNEKTQEIEEIVKSNGGVCKFLGSGGGGCALVFTYDRNNMINSLKDKARILDFKYEVGKW